MPPLLEFYSHTMNPSITPTSPIPIPATSRPTLATPFLVVEGEAEAVAPVAVDACDEAA